MWKWKQNLCKLAWSILLKFMVFRHHVGYISLRSASTNKNTVCYESSGIPEKG